MSETVTLEELRNRVLQFKLLELPGQPPAMHMGTSYLVHDLLDALEAKAMEVEGWQIQIAELEIEIARLKAAHERSEDRPTSEEVEAAITKLVEAATKAGHLEGVLEYDEAGGGSPREGVYERLDDAEQALRSLVRRLAAQSDGWRPIGEAPTNGSILAARFHDGKLQWARSVKWARTGATHFMPLPATPSPSTEENTR